MPPWALAKHPEKPGNQDLKVWADQLKKRLFGAHGETA